MYAVPDSQSMVGVVTTKATAAAAGAQPTYRRAESQTAPATSGRHTK